MRECVCVARARVHVLLSVCVYVRFAIVVASHRTASHSASLSTVPPLRPYRRVSFTQFAPAGQQHPAPAAHFSSHFCCPISNTLSSGKSELPFYVIRPACWATFFRPPAQNSGQPGGRTGAPNFGAILVVADARSSVPCVCVAITPSTTRLAAI